MDAEAAGWPGNGPDAGEHGTPVGADDRLRTAVLAVVGLAVLVGGGWWWQAEAPRTGPLAATPSPTPEAVRPAAPADARLQVEMPARHGRTTSFWILDPATGAVVGPAPGSGATFRAAPGSSVSVRIDSHTGEAVWGDVGPDYLRRFMNEQLDWAARSGRMESLPGTVWTARAVLSSTESLVRQAAAERGARYLLQYRCVGAVGLLVAVDRARAAAPITGACDGSVRSTEVTASGGPFRITLASANAKPLRVEAQLVARP
ncbi:hypothetical protein ABT346_21635 [Micromonospora peucetia]|uniref:hypothetical protein n=1 Tax=Micromonospora peucetia TaxID=47871 RepID=UPI003319560C